MRGTVADMRIFAYLRRITPACAGNSFDGEENASEKQDHPRVCGEQYYSLSNIASAKGSPPRVRGTEGRSFYRLLHCGITPACAGNRRPPGHQSAGCRDHPRVCGEQAAGAYRTRRGVGSPPRVRGTGNHFWIKSIPSRITPACAGNRIFLALALYVFGDHPRVCGEQKIQPVLLALQIGSPPRVRGTDANSFIVSCCVRITPACAGNREISAFMDIEL